jgi:hypothetical protein
VCSETGVKETACSEAGDKRAVCLGPRSRTAGSASMTVSRATEERERAQGQKLLSMMKEST